MRDHHRTARTHSWPELVGQGVALFLAALLVQWLAHRLGLDPSYSVGGSVRFAGVLAVVAALIQAWWERRPTRRD